MKSKLGKHEGVKRAFGDRKVISYQTPPPKSGSGKKLNGPAIQKHLGIGCLKQGGRKEG